MLLKIYPAAGMIVGNLAPSSTAAAASSLTVEGMEVDGERYSATGELSNQRAQGRDSALLARLEELTGTETGMDASIAARRVISVIALIVG